MQKYIFEVFITFLEVAETFSCSHEEMDKPIIFNHYNVWE
jgi:hypothetical protein